MDQSKANTLLESDNLQINEGQRQMRVMTHVEIGENLIWAEICER